MNSSTSQTPKLPDLADKIKYYAMDFVQFLAQNLSPYHVVSAMQHSLLLEGFTQLSDGERWKIERNGKYFLTKNGSAIIAFVVGGAFKPGNGVHMVGTHTDSPCLVLKPKSVGCNVKNWKQLLVAPYGGGIWRSWFDRELGVAGRVFVKQSDNAVKSELVQLAYPVMFIPNLAIHLDRDSNATFKMNLEENMRPIFAASMDPGLVSETTQASDQPANDDKMWSFMEYLAAMHDFDAKKILDCDLCLADANLPTIGGMHEDFIFGGRQDNLISTYAAYRSLLEYAGSKAVASNTGIGMFAAFDNEEVGSRTQQGAGSAWTEWVLRRVQQDADNPCAFEQSISKSFLLSADVSHAVHPNYQSKHDGVHCPLFHHGPVVKYNVTSYATNGSSASKLKWLAERANVPLQVFTNRNDMACGSTIGPILSTRLGIETVDVGNAVLAMHSIREMASTIDLYQLGRLFKTFFQNFHTVEDVFGA